MIVRAYDPETDREGLWECKRAFELGLGAGTGDEGKAAAYEGKLTAGYRERYLEWVDRCVSDEPAAVTVAVDPNGAAREGDDGSNRGAGPSVVGYVFVLPERLAMIWDAAVLNELFVAEPRRGTGLADELMDAAVATAADQDLPLDRLVLDVDPDNERARAFYRRHGFEGWGEMVARPLEGA